MNFLQNYFKDFRNQYLNKANPLCRLEEINLEKKVIIIYCRGISSPIKLSLEEAIYDTMILSNLTPKQASWIGYYYGKYYKNSMGNKKNQHSLVDFAINEESAMFKIKMLDRQGNIIYSHDDQLCTIQPVKAMNDESVINNFAPIQACYIGILAGTSTKKIIESQSHLPNKANLKIVK